MTRKQSYSSDAACLPRRSRTKAGVLDCTGSDAALKYEISNFKSAANRALPPLTASVPHAPSRVVFGALAEHSGRDAAARRPVIRPKTFAPLPSAKLTPDSQINLKIKPKSGRIRPKNESAVTLTGRSPLPGVPRLLKPIEGYPNLLKPFFKNLFFCH
jgi:hypothetical protein